MNRDESEQKQNGGVVYLCETPSFRLLMGIMEIFLGLSIIFALVMTISGISKFGLTEYYRRMRNTVRSFRSDYYDIRAESFDDESVITGNIVKKNKC